MTLAPESVHICIHIFDTRVTVISLGEKRIELFKGFKKIGMMIMRYAMFFVGAYLFDIHAFLGIPTFAENLHRYILENEIRKGFFLNIRICKHDAKTHALVVFLREFKRDLPVLEQIQFAALALR